MDAHVHLFPPRVFAALWRWFDAHAWSVRYRLESEQALEFLLARGVERVVALHYSHKEGMARTLNRYVADLARAQPAIVPFGTVLPGEPDAEAIVREAFGPLGLRGLKLHCHVQAIAIDDPRVAPIFRLAVDADLPVVVHAGRAPRTTGYPVDTDAVSGAARTRRVLERHPRLKLVIPHLGADEIPAHLALLDEFENLTLDTTMVLADLIGPTPPAATLAPYAGRLLYGTDFPNIPCEWDTELSWLRAQPFSDAERAQILGGNARRLFGL